MRKFSNFFIIYIKQNMQLTRRQVRVLIERRGILSIIVLIYWRYCLTFITSILNYSIYRSIDISIRLKIMNKILNYHNMINSKTECIMRLLYVGQGWIKLCLCLWNSLSLRILGTLSRASKQICRIYVSNNIFVQKCALGM